MPIRSPYVRRWLLYGFIASFLHFVAVWICILIAELQHSDFKLTPSIGRWFANGEDWLTFPGVPLHEWTALHLDRFPSAFAAFYGQHQGWFYQAAYVENSVLWGFIIAAAVLYISRRRIVSPSHENAA